LIKEVYESLIDLYFSFVSMITFDQIVFRFTIMTFMKSATFIYENLLSSIGKEQFSELHWLFVFRVSNRLNLILEMTGDA